MNFKILSITFILCLLIWCTGVNAQENVFNLKQGILVKGNDVYTVSDEKPVSNIQAEPKQSEETEIIDTQEIETSTSSVEAIEQNTIKEEKTTVLSELQDETTTEMQKIQEVNEILDENTTTFNSNDSNKLRSSVVKLDISEKKAGIWKKTWTTFKGQPSEDALLLGMFSYHTSDKRDYEEVNNLVGFQYKGWSAGSFITSYDHTAVYVGVARDMYTKHFEKLNLTYKFGYKAGLLYGYGHKYPDLIGLTPCILPINSLDYKALGIDFWFIPDDVKPTFAVNFRINPSKRYWPFKKFSK